MIYIQAKNFTDQKISQRTYHGPCNAMGCAVDGYYWLTVPDVPAVVLRDDTVLPLRFTANLSTAVHAMKDAQAVRAKKMDWVGMPLSVGQQQAE